MKSFLNKQILLISVGMPEQNDAFEEPGINSICAYLRNKGYSVSILLSLNEQMDLDDIKELNPFLIGLSLYSDTFDSVLRICDTLKQTLPKSKIVLGGYIPTYYAEETLNSISSVDYLIRGEGEIAIYELVNSLLTNTAISDVHNLGYKNESGQIVFNKELAPIADLDTLPHSSRDIANQYNPTEIWVSTSRGCVRNCAFCCSQDFWKHHKTRNWRGRSIDSIMNEIEQIGLMYGIRMFEFIDNSFEDPYPFLSRAMQISNEIINRGIKVAFGANMRAETFTNITENQISQLKNAGLSYVYLGLEGFNTTSLSVYKKSANVKQNNDALTFLNTYDIPVDIGFINFNPYLTFDNLWDNIQNLEEHNLAYLHYILTFLYAYKGTGLYDKLRADKLMYKECSAAEPLNYHYINADVEKLALFLLHLRETKDIKSLMDPGFFIVHFNKKIAQIKNLLCKFDLFDGEIKKQFDEVHIYLANYVKSINHTNSKWFKELIIIGKSGFDATKAETATQDVLFREMNKELLNELSGLKMKLFTKAYKKFIKLGVKIK